jgi:hypothetical protein
MFSPAPTPQSTIVWSQLTAGWVVSTSLHVPPVPLTLVADTYEFPAKTFLHPVETAAPPASGQAALPTRRSAWQDVPVTFPHVQLHVAGGA